MHMLFNDKNRPVGVSQSFLSSFKAGSQARSHVGRPLMGGVLRTRKGKSFRLFSGGKMG